MSLWLIDNLSLHSSIFYVPPQLASAFSGSPGPRTTSLAAASILQALLLSPTESLPKIHSELITLANDPNAIWRLLLAAAMTPFKGITYQDKKAERLAVEAVIREGLKVIALRITSLVHS